MANDLHVLMSIEVRRGPRARWSATRRTHSCLRFSRVCRLFPDSRFPDAGSVRRRMANALLELFDDPTLKPIRIPRQHDLPRRFRIAERAVDAATAAIEIARHLRNERNAVPRPSSVIANLVATYNYHATDRQSPISRLAIRLDSEGSEDQIRVRDIECKAGEKNCLLVGCLGA